MKIGFSSVFSWRPHVEHVIYLSQLIRESGHQVSFLTCDANLPTCYTRELRPSKGGMAHCLGCRAGGVRSYERQNVVSIGDMHASNSQTLHEAYDWSRSSASSLGRFESDQDYAGEEFKRIASRLSPAIAKAYFAARNWIERERLDAVCVFNGRMDITRAIVEAARATGTRFISIERTWFGDGLQLLPDETCIGLKSVDRMMAAWSDKPLSHSQAIRAAKHIASRFMRNNTKEWRAYNVAASEDPWPATNGRYRVLLLPGSRNEVFGHPDWDDYWPEKTAAYDALIDHLGLAAADLVLRCHPNWSEKIGLHDGHMSEAYYTNWASKRGIAVIKSTASASTLGLIGQADAVVVGGSSAGLEAGILGKQVIAVSPSIYQEANFQDRAYGLDDLVGLKLATKLELANRQAAARRISRQTLRFAHTMVYRIPQYVDYVRCVTTTKYNYREGADPSRFLNLIKSGVLQPDDSKYATDAGGEDAILEMIAALEWQSILNEPLKTSQASFRTIKRRFAFRAIDNVREYLPHGDRWGE